MHYETESSVGKRDGKRWEQAVEYSPSQSVWGGTTRISLHSSRTKPQCSKKFSLAFESVELS